MKLALRDARPAESSRDAALQRVRASSADALIHVAVPVPQLDALDLRRARRASRSRCSARAWSCRSARASSPASSSSRTCIRDCDCRCSERRTVDRDPGARPGAVRAIKTDHRRPRHRAVSAARRRRRWPLDGRVLRLRRRRDDRAAMPPRAWIESERHAPITDAGRWRAC